MSGQDGRDIRRILKTHDKVNAIYADNRFNDQREGARLRGFLISLIWSHDVEQRRGEALRDRLTSLYPSNVPKDPFFTIRAIIRTDLPRYEPPDTHAAWHGVGCGSPMIRRDGTCGQRASEAFRVTDPITGHWHMTGYCSRHRDWGQAERQAEQGRRACGNLPDPIPNTGGLAPSHSQANWANLYTWADPYWQPPAVGLIAADWPVIAKVQAHRKPDFTVLGGGHDMAVPAGPRPVFELIPGGA